MVITSSDFDNRTNRFKVVVEDVHTLYLSYETVTRYGLYSQSEVPASLLGTLQNESEDLTALEAVFSILSRKPATSFEVAQKLRQKKISEERIEKTVQWFVDARYLDDAAYLEMAVKDQIELKGYGLWRIVSNLSVKGFKKGEVSAVYEKLTNAESDTERARSYAIQKWPSIRGQSVPHRKKKLSDQLLRRGFSYDTVSSVLSEFDE